MSIGSLGFSGTLDDIRISDLTHPDYDADELYWEKWRLAYRGGEQFINRYMQKFSKRENLDDFIVRKLISYVPAFSKTAINNVKNAVFQRRREISRSGGPKSYQDAVAGKGSGIDRLGSTMNSFMARKIVPELLTMAKVGVYVDMPPLNDRSLRGKTGKNPYIYMYQVEDIRSWVLDESERPNQFKSILLRDREFVLDDRTNLPASQKISYRHLWLDDVTGKVNVQLFDEESEPTTETMTLDIDRIPFVLFDIGDSLMADVAQYQIALMNLASSDIAFCLLANYPFYTEEFDPATEMTYFKPEGGQGTALEIDNTISGQAQGSAADDYSKQQEISVGNTVGRRYPKGTERPDFINPSPDPLTASMAKQEQIKAEIFELVNQRLSDIGASAESKQLDQSNLESGLSFIGLMLEHGEREIAALWSMYENTKDVATVTYPDHYSIKSDEDRRKDTEALRKNMVSVPSKTFRKSLAKEIACVQLGGKISRADLEKIYTEIDAAEDVVDDPANLITDVQEGLVSPPYASKLRGYPADEAEKAEEAHARKLERIAFYQAKGAIGDVTETEGGSPTQIKAAGARGVAPLATSSNQGSAEKKASRDNTKQQLPGKKVRGPGKNNQGGG